MKCLLLGAGFSRQRKVLINGADGWPGELITLDMNPESKPTVVWDLERRPLPFEDETFAEIHAYDVLEHIGRQGDWRDFFDQYAEYHRLLVPGGMMAILVPVGEDALVDPGHGRFYHQNHFHLLSQGWYDEQAAAGKQSGDYRWYWKKNFEVEKMVYASGPDPVGVHHLGVVLRKK